MPSPAPYFDDDRPRRGSPQLVGSGASLGECRRTADYRSGSPAAVSPRFLRDTMILYLVRGGFTQTAVARVLGISQSVVSDSVRKMQALAEIGLADDDGDGNR